VIAFALCPFFVKSILFFLENKHYRYFLDIFLKKGSFGRDCRYFFKKKKEDNQIIVRFMHILQKKDTIRTLYYLFRMPKSFVLSDSVCPLSIFCQIYTIFFRKQALSIFFGHFFKKRVFWQGLQVFF